ncbi:MAG: hypothetical protein CMM95_00525 [Rickettsiales bacterium]|nr:hypothetical protein [Rickettsiales bacterium]|tara:strand:+ start:280 stop:735 length:456 start_codon:yes stop_codon:yes gene_type:complete
MDENSFKELHGFFIEELEINQETEYRRIILENDIQSFAEVSGDKNPVHTNEEFAKKTIFRKKIAHGFLTASLISTVIATQLPGPGSIYISQSLRFLAPVFINDEVIVKVKVISIDSEKKKVKLLTECFKNEKKILTGEAEVLVASKSDVIQ